MCYDFGNIIGEKAGKLMESLEKIESYINEMNIKKAIIGGYDREDVYSKMNGLIDVLREYVKEEMEENELQRRKAEMQLVQQKEEVEGYKKKLADLQSTVAELQKKLDSLTNEQIEAEKGMEEMKDICKKCCSDIVEHYSGSLQTLSAEFSKMLENISMLQQNIVELEGIKTIKKSSDVIEEEEIFKLPDWEIDLDEWFREDDNIENPDVF